MSIIRIQHDKNYTCIHNDAIRDKRLSWKARGLHHFLLSQPNNWQINTEHLVKQSDEDGRTAVLSALNELRDWGYLVQRQIKDKEGKFAGWEKVLTELPSKPNAINADDQKNPVVEEAVASESALPSKPNAINADDQKNPVVEEAVASESAVGFSDCGKPDCGKPNRIINTNRQLSTNFKEVLTYKYSRAENFSPQEKERPDLSLPLEQDARSQPNLSLGGEDPDIDLSSAAVFSLSKNKYIYPTQKFGDRFWEKFHLWRKSNKANDFDFGFVQYLVTKYLPSTPHYQSQVVTKNTADRWITRRESNERELALIESVWTEYQEVLKVEEETTAWQQREVADIGEDSLCLFSDSEHRKRIKQMLCVGEEEFKKDSRNAQYLQWVKKYRKPLLKELTSHAS
jgi:hypothetical protein